MFSLRRCLIYLLPLSLFNTIAQIEATSLVNPGRVQ
jgi:hypothetical protein